jgi:predicted ATPase
MVGRQFELDTLRQAFNRLRQEQQGGFCAVIGEAGIGKSRLLAEFQTWLGTQPTAVNLLQGRAGPEMQNRPYALLREVFAMHFQIQESEALSEVWRKLEDGFTLQDERSLPTSPTQTAEQSGRARAHVVGQLLGYDFSASPYVQPLLDDPQQLRDRALRYLEDYLGEIAQSAPTLLFLDDLHWADDSSLELVDYLARQLPELPLLLVALTRPSLFERQPDWAPGGEQYIRLDLQLLSSQESQQLVAEILKAVPNIPESLNSLILHSAEGNPFYMEELVKMLIDRGDILVREAGWQVAAERLTALQVPPTLAGVLQARLDSLPAAEQQVLKQASVVGRLFWDHAVAHLAHQQGT